LVFYILVFTLASYLYGCALTPTPIHGIHVLASSISKFIPTS